MFHFCSVLHCLCFYPYSKTEPLIAVPEIPWESTSTASGSNDTTTANKTTTEAWPPAQEGHHWRTATE